MPIDIVVVGAGLAGLAAAIHLQRHGVDVLVCEAGDEVGGRIRTDRVEGFRLDRGFQVLLPAYPELRRQVDLPRLGLRPFTRGVIAMGVDRRWWLTGPWHGRAALAGAADLFGHRPVDVAALAALALRDGLGPVALARRHTTRSVAEELPHWHLSARTIDDVLRPFPAGVFLDPLLSTDARVFHLIWRCFLRGGGAVPAEGMQALPQQLAGNLADATIRTAAEACAIEGTRVRLLGGETISARGGRRHRRQHGRATVARGRPTELARCHHLLLRRAALTSALAHAACRWTQRPLAQHRRSQRCRGAVRAAGTELDRRIGSRSRR
ncbi:FAD-dependent oxidoreductase [Nocardia sp. NPDC058499]|uniref:FAD-dependent oxidoreductase n=1 Tax=Nocardia sp. NPDC058499 TaxID=3346530 RepID=UPI0036660309